MRRYATEREGFEPSETRRPHRFSKPARSAAPAPLPGVSPLRIGDRNTTRRGVDGQAPHTSGASQDNRIRSNEAMVGRASSHRAVRPEKATSGFARAAGRMPAPPTRRACPTGSGQMRLPCGASGRRGAASGRERCYRIFSIELERSGSGEAAGGFCAARFASPAAHNRRMPSGSTLW
jgi:hypothetical protein